MKFYDIEINEQDKKCIDSYFEIYYPLIFRFYSVYYDEEMVATALACVYQIALKKATLLKKHPKPGGWLYNSVGKQLKTLERKQKRLKTVPLDSVAEVLFSSDFTDIEEDSVISDDELQFYKHKCIDQLSIQERELYSMRFTEKQSIDEISKHYSISKNAVNVRIHRLKQKLEYIAVDILQNTKNVNSIGGSKHGRQ